MTAQISQELVEEIQIYFGDKFQGPWHGRDKDYAVTDGVLYECEFPALFDFLASICKINVISAEYRIKPIALLSQGVEDGGTERGEPQQ